MELTIQHINFWSISLYQRTEKLNPWLSPLLKETLTNHFQINYDSVKLHLTLHSYQTVGNGKTILNGHMLKGLCPPQSQYV